MFSLPDSVRNPLLFLARLGLGIVLCSHGCQKLFEWGMPATISSFQNMGAPIPTLSAWVAALTEFLGGMLIILGAATPLIGILVTLHMLGAWFIVHLGSGSIFIKEGGPELVISIGCAALFLAASGPGAWSLDSYLARRKNRHHP